MTTVKDVLGIAAGDSFPNVVIPASVIEDSVALERYPSAQQQRWADRTHEALYSLNRYVSAKHRGERPFRGNFYTFCTMTTESAIPPSIVKLVESNLLMANPRLAKLRRFPIDPKANPTGSCSMQSHIVIQHRGSPAPRLYFLDDSLGATASIHIGYVGKHLDNMVTEHM